MAISALKLDSDAVDVETTDTVLRLVLADGRELTAPLEWFPRLRDTTPEQRRNWRLIAVAKASTGPMWTRISRSRPCCEQGDGIGRYIDWDPVRACIGANPAITMTSPKFQMDRSICLPR